MRDDVTYFSGCMKARLGGEHFATIREKYSVVVVYSSLFFRNATLVYCLRLYKFFRHGNQKVLVSLTTAKQGLTSHMPIDDLCEIFLE